MKISEGVISDVADEDIVDGTFSFPEGIAEIGPCLFQGRAKLQSIFLPKGVKMIGARAFKDCAVLQSIVFSEGIELIGSYAFQGCKSLRSIVLPEGVKLIGDAAFYDCTMMQSIRFTGRVEKIGGAVFEDCPNLRVIHIFNASTEERQHIRNLLPERVGVLVASEEFTQRVLDINDKELRRILQYSASNAMRRSAKSIGFFPEEVFTEINKQTNPKDHVFYQKAQREIDKLVLPASESDLEVYEAQVKTVVDMVIERAKRGLYSPDEVSVSTTTMKS